MSIAVVAVSILVYDRVLRSPPDQDRAEALEADDVGRESGRRPAASDVSGRVADQERRIGQLETALEGLRDDIEKLTQTAEEIRKQGDQARTLDPDAPLDENELDKLRAQMDELDRRAEKKRMTAMVRRKLELVGVPFSETENAALLERLTRHKIDVNAFWTRVRDEAIADQDVIQSEMQVINDEAGRDVRRLLPAEKADKVIAAFGLAPPGR